MDYSIKITSKTFFFMLEFLIICILGFVLNGLTRDNMP